MRSIEATGKSVDAAIFSGLQQLGISIDEVTIDIIQMETKGILGIGAKPAKVRLTEKPAEEVIVPDFNANRESEQRERKERNEQRERRNESKYAKREDSKTRNESKSKRIEDSNEKRNERAEYSERPRYAEKKKLYRNIEEMFAAQESSKGENASNDSYTSIEFEQDDSIGEGTLLNSNSKVVTTLDRGANVSKHETKTEAKESDFKKNISSVVREAEELAYAMEEAELNKHRMPKSNKNNKGNRPERRNDKNITPVREEKQSKPEVVINYNEEDAKGNPAAEFVAGLIEHMGIKGKVLAANEEGATRLRIDSEAMGVLIGHRGETLDSIQYLTSLVINRNRKTEGYTRVTINTEDYREKREETLIKLAKRVAQQVKATGRARILEPMNPYERRILHATLQNNPFVATHSEGEEPNRRVVVTPKRRGRNYQNRRPDQRRQGNNRPAKAEQSAAPIVNEG